MSKEFGYRIKIDGINEVNNFAGAMSQAKRELSEVRKLLKDPVKFNLSDSDIKALEKREVQLKGITKELGRQQRVQEDLFTSTAKGVGAYAQLNSKLNVSRREYKDLLAKKEQNISLTDEEIKKFQRLEKEVPKLDKQLKNIDSSVGQFQRNVGNYPTSIGALITGQIPELERFGTAFQETAEITSRAGRLMSRAFIVFGALQGLSEIIGNVSDFSKEFNELRATIERTTNLTGQALDELTVKSKAFANVFGTDVNETIQATNTIITRFGVNSSQALESLERGLLLVGDRSKFLGNVNDELKKLTDIGLGLDDSIGAIVQATNQNFNIDVLAEPLIALREQTTASVEALETAFGKERTAEIFQTFKDEPIKAIQEISKGFSELDSRSRESGLLLADVFKSQGEDDVAFVKSLADINFELDDLLENLPEATKREFELLRANEELANAQNEVAKRLNGANSGFKTLKTQIKAGFINILVQLLDIIRPVIQSFVNVGKSLSSLFSVFTKGKNEISIFKAVFETLAFPLRLVSGILQTVANGIVYLVNRFRGLIAESPKLQKLFSNIGKYISGIVQPMSNIGAIIRGVGSAFFEFLKVSKDVFNSAGDYANLFGLKIRKALSFGKVKEQLDRQIKEIESRGVNFANLGERIGKAFNEGIEKAKAEQKLIETENINKTNLGGNGNGEPIDDLQTLKNENTEREKLREQALGNENKYYDELISLKSELSKRIIDLSISNIEEQRDREILAENQRYNDTIKQIEDNYKSLYDKQLEQGEKIKLAFGGNSTEYLNFLQKSNDELLQIESENNKLREQLAIEHNNKILEINKAFAESESKKRLENLQEELQGIEDEYKRSNTELEKQRLLLSRGIGGDELNKLNIKFDLEQFAKDRDRISNELALLKSQLDFYENDALELGINVPQSEINEVQDKYNNLFNNLLKLENDYTNKVDSIRIEQERKRAETVEKIGNVTKQALDSINQFFDSNNQRELERLELQKTESENKISDLETELEVSSGLKKQAIAEEIRAERKRLNDLNKEQENYEREQAKRQKTISATKSAIDTIIGVQKAYVSQLIPGDPTSIIRAVIAGVQAGIFGAAQTAAILAQPLATGGEVLPTQLPDGGGVVSIRNAPTSNRGDNALVYATVGEMFLNKRQQERATSIYGADIWRNIGIPTFNNGGLLTPPNVSGLGSFASGSNSSLLTEIRDFINVSNIRINSIERQTNELINRDNTKKIIFVQDEYDELQNDKVVIQTNTRLQ